MEHRDHTAVRQQGRSLLSRAALRDGQPIGALHVDAERVHPVRFDHARLSKAFGLLDMASQLREVGPAVECIVVARAGLGTLNTTAPHRGRRQEVSERQIFANVRPA